MRVILYDVNARRTLHVEFGSKTQGIGNQYGSSPAHFGEDKRCTWDIWVGTQLQTLSLESYDDILTEVCWKPDFPPASL
jgi:hypothetical protein